VRVVKFPLRALLVSAFAVLGCSDQAGGEGSASASAAPPPPCSAIPFADALSRCKQNEARCCDVASQSSDPKNADHLDVMGVTCAGGNETSCQAVRDSDRDPKWKLESLDKACTRFGRWTCRAAVQLAVAYDWERMPKVFENYCRQSGDPELRLAGQTFKCPSYAKSNVESLKADGERCRNGAPDACKSIADVDAAGKKLLMAPLWSKRGVVGDVASEAWVMPVDLSTEKPEGKVAFSSADKAEAPVMKSLEAATKENLRRCLATRANRDGALKGELTVELTLDNAAKVAYGVPKETLFLEPRVAKCFLSVLQDAAPEGAKPSSKLTATIKVSP
jgi:hypothetical protein